MSQPREPLVQHLSLIPRWAVVLALLLFLAGAGGMLYLFQTHESNPPPLVFQVFLATFVAAFPALFILGVGYVRRDARRRGMSANLWTLLVIVVPNAIGFILYFLLRQPLRLPCPACGSSAPTGSQFCPSCGARLRAGCPACGRVVDEGALYCSNCGRSLAA